MKYCGFLLAVLFPLFLSAQDPYFVVNNPSGHHSSIIKLLITDEGNTAITFGRDQSICFWDVTSANLKKKVWLDISDNSRFIDADIDDHLNLMAIARVNPEGQHVVNFYSLTEQRIIGTIIGLTSYLGFVEFDPNSRFIITGVREPNAADEKIKLWEIPNFTKEHVQILKPTAEIDAMAVHDYTFYKGGSRLILTSALSQKLMALEIFFDANAIPSYKFGNVTPFEKKIDKSYSHVVYRSEADEVLAAHHDGKMVLIDGTGEESPISIDSKAKDMSLGWVYIDKTGNTAYIKNHDGNSLLIDVESKTVIDNTLPFFEQVVFATPTTILGFEGVLTHLDTKTGLEKKFQDFDYLEDDPIGLTSSKTVIFDSTSRQFSFENLELNQVNNDLRQVSYPKYKFNNLEITDSDGGWLGINDEWVKLRPSLMDIGHHSFINNGMLVISTQRARQDDLFMYTYESQNSQMWPESKFIGPGEKYLISGITPSYDISSMLFVTKDIPGVISLYDAGSELFDLKFESNAFVFNQFKGGSYVNWETKKPQLVHQNKANKKDIFTGVNKHPFKDDKSLNKYLESIDPQETISIEFNRDGHQKSIISELNSYKVISPLLSVINIEDEWLCWSPEGYYAASAGGEKFGGWVVNRNGVNQVAEFHPIYDFKKNYYNPDLIKLIAKEESFEKAVTVYNETAVIPIGENTDLAANFPPSVTWTNPASRDTTFNQNLVKLNARITSDSDISNAKILMNGRTVLRRDQVSIREIKTGIYSINFEIDLVSKNNTINLFVENENGSTISEERIIKANQIVKGLDRFKPNLYMVSIGVSDHSISDHELNFADNDAEAMSEMYRDQKGLLYKDVFQRTLTNEKATRSNILDAFYWLEQNATQKDVVVIFIASHGINERDKFYILPYDGDPQRIRITGVDWLNFSDILGNLPSKVLMFLDACHSGKLGSNVLASRGRTDLVEAIRALATEENGVVIMAASTGKEYAFESAEWGHGAFTLALLEGLGKGKADLNDNGIVNIREIDYYVAERVKELSGGKQHPTTQKPSVVAEFPLVQVKNE